MPPFPKPKLEYNWNEQNELDSIINYQTTSQYKIPNPDSNTLLLGTWNIANFDTQKREKKAYTIISQIIKPFDLIAIQEVNQDLSGLDSLMSLLNKDKQSYSCLFTDIGGNSERLCYIYKHEKIVPAPHIGELDIPATYKKDYHLKFGEQVIQFQGFDRNPYIASWKFKGQTFTTYNCHMYFGEEKKKNITKFRRRIVEIYSMVKWISNKIKNPADATYSSNIILLGDMNVPSMKKDDEVFKQLKIKYFRPLDYTDYLTPYSNIANNTTYDQLVVVDPFSSKITLKQFGVFAWDNAVFADLWADLQAKYPKSQAASKFQAYAKWAISDHRVLWSLVEFT